jgi:hypothetical protein
MAFTCQSLSEDCANHTFWKGSDDAHNDTNMVESTVHLAREPRDMHIKLHLASKMACLVKDWRLEKYNNT